MHVKECLTVTKLVLLDICLNLTNLVLTFANINLFYESKEYSKFGSISLFLLWFPGIVTAIGFLYLYFTGSQALAQLDKKKLVIYPLCLLLLYPLLPVLLTVVHLFKKDEVHHERARLARLFSSFLDHGPQFVIRVVVVVLLGVPHRGLYDRDDVLFILSMFASIMSLVLSAIVFNERRSNIAIKLFISTPMFTGIVASRAFTLAVFMKEALKDSSWGYQELVGFGVLLILAVINLGLYRWCGQDWPRSVVFSLTSLLVPSGYNNDPQYYQLPGQNLLKPQDKYERAPRLRRQESVDMVQTGNDPVIQTEAGETENTQDITQLIPMKSGRYLLCHIIINSVVLAMFSIYFYTISNLEPKDNEVLVLPQTLCLIPGLFFGLGRSLLHDDIIPLYEDNTTRSEKCCGGIQKGVKIFLASFFTFTGYVALVPAILYCIVYKIVQAFASEDVAINIDVD